MKQHSAFAALAALLIGVLVGYGIGAGRVEAQAETFPFRVGETIEVGQTCRIEEMRGSWVRCQSPAGLDIATDTWVNMAAVDFVKRRR